MKCFLTFIFLMLLICFMISVSYVFGETKIYQENVSDKSVLFNEEYKIYCSEEKLKIGDSKVFCSECHKITRIDQNYCIMKPLKLNDQLNNEEENKK